MSAFSLIEVVLALGIVSFAMVSIFGLICLGIGSVRQSLDSMVRTQIAQGIVSDAQLADFDNLADYHVYYDEDGNEVTAADTRQIYAVQVALSDLPDSLTSAFSSQIEKDLVIKIRNKSHPYEIYVYSAVLVKND
jgi:uncharacterized protein (TIGR02598 family)